MNNQDIKILIVEDDPLVAKDVKNKLISLDYQVTAIVDNGDDAINHVTHQQPDLILMDIVLSNAMDGIQAATIIQKKHNIPIIYLTAYSDQVFLERAKITDPMAYILKPATDRDLHATITIALNKAENERQRNENNFLNATLVSFADALVVWNTQGNVIRVNDAFLKILAAKEHDIVGKNIAEVLNLKKLDDQQFVIEELIYTVEKQGTLKDEYDYILSQKEGFTLPVRISANRIFDHKQLCYGYVMIIRDDTQRKQYEWALLESETRFRQLVDHIESIFLLSDLQKKQIIYISPAYEKICGYSAIESSIHTFPFINIIHTDDKKKADAFISSLYQQKYSEESFRIVKPDGAIRWVHARCYPVYEPKNDKIYRMACIIDDVTEQKKSKIKLQQAAKVYDNTAEGIMITDTDLNIIAVNQAFTRITGYTEQEILGMTPRILQSGVHGKSFYQNMWAHIKKAGYWQGEITNRRKNGETYPQWSTISAIRGENKTIINYVAVLSDISDIKKSRDKLNYLAHHDPLTGLANRLLFNARLEHAIVQANRNHYKVAVVLLDLDSFKDVNDSLGHIAGDKLLKILALRIKRCLREEDTLARLGGDEFVFLLEEIYSQQSIELIAKKIQNLFRKPFLLEETNVIATASIGISIYPDNGKNAPLLIKHADIAMYKAKQQGKNCFTFYSEEFNKAKLNRLTLSTQMRFGLDNNEFIVYYQPQISLHTGKINGMEALIRWQHPERGLISPIQFIPLAEETGFIEKLGAWVLYTACRQCKLWHDQGFNSIVMAVNLSAREFMFSDIVSTVKSTLEKTGLEACFLELEITESGLMDQAEKVTSTLDALKSIGVSLSIDDFGTGYSSLSYLRRFPIDKLKIDRSFVKDLPDNRQDATIFRSIVALGKSLSLTVIAEGVETELQREFILAENCDEMQGYLFSPPVSAEEFETLLKADC